MFVGKDPTAREVYPLPFGSTPTVSRSGVFVVKEGGSMGEMEIDYDVAFEWDFKPDKRKRSTPVASNNHLTTIQQQVAIPNADQLSSMLLFAENAVKSGLLPSHIKTPQAAFAVIQMGQELRIPPMAALRGIYVIGGKPTCDAAMMQALIYRDHGDNALIPVESTPEKCTYRFKRSNWSEYQEYTYSKDDAQKAGLWGNKGPWTNFPRDMLRSRCISVIARMAFQDTVSGLFTYDELGADVTLSPDGEMQIVEIPSQSVPQSQPPKQVTERKPVNMNEPPAELGAGDFDREQLPEIASEKQIRFIATLTPEAGYTDESLKSTWLKTAYGVDSKKELTAEQASEVIHMLQVTKFAEQLKAAESEEALTAIASEIKKAGVTGQERKQLGDYYSKRLEELTSAGGDDELDSIPWEDAKEVELS